MASNYLSIEGWFDFDDLYDLALRRCGSHPACAVEIGAYKGRPTSYMAERIRETVADIGLSVICVQRVPLSKLLISLINILDFDHKLLNRLADRQELPPVTDAQLEPGRFAAGKTAHLGRFRCSVGERSPDIEGLVDASSSGDRASSTVIRGFARMERRFHSCILHADSVTPAAGSRYRGDYCRAQGSNGRICVTRCSITAARWDATGDAADQTRGRGSTLASCAASRADKSAAGLWKNDREAASAP
jgi:hypothetical protein